MSTSIFTCGAECGVTAIGTAALSTNGRHWSTFGATATNVANTEPAGLDMPGTRTWKFNPSAGTDDTLAHLFPTAIASPSTMVVRFKLQFRVLPNAIHTICSSQAGLHGIRYNPTGTQLEAWAGTATTVVAGAFVPTVDTIYHVECKFVRGTTHTTDWRINGAAQTQASKGSVTAGTQTGVTFGHNGTGQGGSVSATATYYIDDILVSGTAADYDDAAFTDTDATVAALFPSADGTHVYTGDSFAWPAAANVQASSATTAWTALHDTTEGLTATISDFVSQVAIRTGYVEIRLADLSVTPESINGVELIGEFHGSTTGAHGFGFHLVDGSFDYLILNSVDASDVTVSYDSSHYAVALSTSGAWTKTLVDALLVRWGYADDVIGNPILDGVALEVDYIATGGIALAGTGAAAAAGIANLKLTAALTGHGDGATVGVAALNLAAALRSHGDAATAAAADLTVTPPAGDPVENNPDEFDYLLRAEPFRWLAGAHPTA